MECEPYTDIERETDEDNFFASRKNEGYDFMNVGGFENELENEGYELIEDTTDAQGYGTKEFKKDKIVISISLRIRE